MTHQLAHYNIAGNKKRSLVYATQDEYKDLFRLLHALGCLFRMYRYFRDSGVDVPEEWSRTVANVRASITFREAQVQVDEDRSYIRSKRRLLDDYTQVRTEGGSIRLAESSDPDVGSHDLGRAEADHQHTGESQPEA